MEGQAAIIFRRLLTECNEDVCELKSKHVQIVDATSDSCSGGSFSKQFQASRTLEQTRHLLVLMDVVNSVRNCLLSWKNGGESEW